MNNDAGKKMQNIHPNTQKTLSSEPVADGDLKIGVDGNFPSLDVGVGVYDVGVGVYSDEALKDLVEAGVFYGRKKSKTHPRMKPFIFGNRGGVEVINLHKAMEQAERAAEFLKEKIAAGGSVLLVGTQPAAEEGLKKMAEKLELSFVSSRWLGGTLTNFKVIQKRIEYYKKLKADKASGALMKYTKKERVMFDKELARLDEFFSGLENLAARPGVLIVVDAVWHRATIREAARLNIPVIAFINTDTDPKDLEYPVSGNNKGRKSINWFLKKMEDAIAEGKTMVKPVVVATTTDKPAEAAR